MARRSKGADINLDSFLDIMTCLVGVLVLVLILTGIDAGQIKVLIPTPMEHKTDMNPIYIECRDNEMFVVSIRELQALTRDALVDIGRNAGGDEIEMLQLLEDTEVGDENYKVDLTYTLLGQCAIQAVEGTRGYALEDVQAETEQDWFGKILTSLDRETEMLTFLVRDDSFGVFKRARHIAWKWKVEVSYQLLDVDDVVKFGLGGSSPLPQ